MAEARCGRARHPARAAARRPAAAASSTPPPRPQPVARLEGYRLPDWERQGSQWRIPRSSLTPILRFADVRPSSRRMPGRRRARHALRRLPPGRRRQGGAAALPARHRRPGTTPPTSSASASARSPSRPPPIAAAAAPTATTTGSSRPCGPTSRRSTGGWRSRLRTHRHGLPADEGDPRARRGAGPGAGRPMTDPTTDAMPDATPSPPARADRRCRAPNRRCASDASRRAQPRAP